MIPYFEKKNIQNKRLTHNERFGVMAAVTRPKVCADLQVLRPSEWQWKPRLRQAASTLQAILVDNACKK
jgi:hypothetical protein